MLYANGSFFIISEHINCIWCAIQRTGIILGYSSAINCLANCIALAPSDTIEQKRCGPISVRTFLISWAVKRPVCESLE